MVDSIKIEVGLDGSEEVKRDLYDIGVAGRQAFATIAEAAALLSAALAAGIVVAIGAAGKKLIEFADAAEKTEKALTQLQNVSKESFENLSALQIVFAQGGTSAQKFASTFTAIEVKVQEASRTMANEVEQSSQRIVQAHQAEAQAALSVESAELNLYKIRVAQRSGSQTAFDNAQDRERIANAEKKLKIAQAEQQVAAAQLAQQQAQHNARVAEANDLGRIIGLYTQIANGVKVAFDPLTTQATKNEALLGSLARAGENWRLKLADILKNASALERIQIGKALGLTPEEIRTLQVGNAELRRLEEAAKRFFGGLTPANQQALQGMNQQWNEFMALVTAFFQKLGALAAPELARLYEIFKQTMQAIISDFEKLPLPQAIANLGQRLTPAFNAILELLMPIITSIGKSLGDALGRAFVDAISASLSEGWQNMKDTWSRRLGLTGQGPGGGDSGGVPNIPPMAGGGLLGGSGTGTSDSNLAWVSRGEHIMPARAVAQPGVLALLEALRHSGGNLSGVLNGMGRFALGGLVPRAMPAFASGGLAGMSHVTIAFPGLPAIGGLRASSDVVDQLHKAAALAQVRSGGRKPSRYS